MLLYKIIEIENILQDELKYKDQVVMKYSIKYPKFISDKFYIQKNLRDINSFYTEKSFMYKNINIMTLYKSAIEEYEYSVANEFPIRVYESVINYEVTYNKDFMISLYFDRYEYTGGAHGSTIRSSDTWNLITGKEIELYQLFPDTINYQEYIIKNINKQIEEDIKNGNNIYFEDYNQLVSENFNKDNYYLVKDGIMIYYQQYEIAPYASGIPTFLIPLPIRE